MISIKKVSFKNSMKFLKENFSGNINIKKDIILIARENYMELGYIIIKEEDNYGLIKGIFVREYIRSTGVGDALLKSAFNILKTKNISVARYEESCSYLINKGFKNQNNLLECNIDDFFYKNSCKGDIYG